MRGARATGHDHAGVTSEAFVPDDHPQRRIKPLVDECLARLSPRFDEMDASRGRPSRRWTSAAQRRSRETHVSRTDAEARLAIREGGLSDRVLLIYEWDEAAQTWKGFFPGLEDVPALNTLTTLLQGST